MPTGPQRAVASIPDATAPTLPAAGCVGRLSLTGPTRAPLVAAAAVAAGGAVAALPLLGEAVGAVDRLVAARLEGDLGLLAALAAHRRVHLALRAVVAPGAVPTAGVAAATRVAAARAVAATVGVAATATLLGLARRATLGAAPRLVGESAAREELLLAGGEGERLAAVAAGEGLVLVTHACACPFLVPTRGHRSIEMACR